MISICISDCFAGMEDACGEYAAGENVFPEKNTSSSQPRTRRRRSATCAFLPRVPKNDLRRHLPAMFINTLNSADFDAMQNFWNTFMSPSCRVTSGKETLTPFGIPHGSSVHGPRLMAHYMAGCYVMFPDLVVTLLNHQIVTSSVDHGARIVMEVNFKCTKLTSISADLWMPPFSSLLGLYQTFSVPPPTLKCAAENDAAPVVRPGRKRKLVQYEVPSQLSGFPCIPKRFIAHLHDAAVGQPAVPVRERGVITLHLDQENHLQYIHIAVAPAE